jgi:hypothetical protein
MLTLAFEGEVIHWRGPAPFYFVRVPTEASQNIQEIAHVVTYGWGVIPVTVALGNTTWTTSLFPKDGGYLVPIRAVIRKAEKVEEGDSVPITLVVGGSK